MREIPPNPSVAHILTWNPKYEEISDDVIEQTLVDLKHGSTIIRSWSVGRHKNNFIPGNLVYLLRQGDDRKGIVAQGKLISPVYKDTFKGNSNRSGNFVDYQLESIVPIDNRLPFESLQRFPHFSEINWGKHFRESGKTLTGNNAEKLKTLWDIHLEFPRSECPSCGDYSVVRIAYGFPSQDLMDAASLGLAIIGGCVISEFNPKSACTSCDWIERIDNDEIYDENPLGIES